MSLPSTRKKARALLVQALYQWQVSGGNIGEIEAQFFADNVMTKVDTIFFRELLHAIPADIQKIDEAFELYLDRKISELDPISLSILRIGTYELMQRIDVPYKVAINEAVNLAKKFGPTDAHKFINSILDKVSARLRVIEMRAEAKKPS